MINIIKQPDNYYTDENTWFIVYDPNSLIAGLGPIQSGGKTTSPLIMVTADTDQEILQYMLENNIKTELELMPTDPEPVAE